MRGSSGNSVVLCSMVLNDTNGTMPAAIALLHWLLNGLSVEYVHIRKPCVHAPFAFGKPPLIAEPRLVAQAAGALAALVEPQSAVVVARSGLHGERGGRDRVLVQAGHSSLSVYIR